MFFLRNVAVYLMDSLHRSQKLKIYLFYMSSNADKYNLALRVHLARDTRQSTVSLDIYYLHKAEHNTYFT